MNVGSACWHHLLPLRPTSLLLPLLLAVRFLPRLRRRLRRPPRHIQLQQVLRHADVRRAGWHAKRHARLVRQVRLHDVESD